MPKYDVNNVSVQSLLSWIREGEVAIPEIQRPFVWDASKVRDLIDSLYSGFPIGYIVVWKNPDIKLKDGTISAGKKILIDGQQRITALQAALVGTKVVQSDYSKTRIAIAFNPLATERRFEVCNSIIRKNPAWIPDIAELFKGNMNIFEFIPQYCKKNNIPMTQAGEINQKINNLLNIQYNNLGVIELASDLDIEQVTEIFIRINSKGVVLSQADFAMSKISADTRFNGNIMRKTIDYFCHFMQKPEEYSLICEHDAEFVGTEQFRHIKWSASVEGNIYVPEYTDVLRVAFTYTFLRGKLSDLVNLLSGRDFSSREYKESIAEESFQRLTEGINEFTNETNFKRYVMIVKSTGLISRKLIRSQNVLNFGYILYLLLRDKKVAPAKIEYIVRRWIILSILTGRYSGSPESTFEYDVRHFNETTDGEAYLQSVEEGELSDAFWQSTLVRKLETPVKSSPMFHIFLMAMIKLRVHGFLSSQIETQLLIEQRGDVHHIFPKKYLQKNGIHNPSQYNQIANYTYTQSEINIRIKDKAPCVYMKEVDDQCHGGKLLYGTMTSIHEVEKNLQENCIPTDLVTMDYTQYEQFLRERRVLMAAFIRRYYESLK